MLPRRCFSLIETMASNGSCWCSQKKRLFHFLYLFSRQRFLAHCPLPHFVCSVEITDFTLRCACDFSRAFAAKYPNRPGLRKSKYTEQLTREDITELLTVANPGNPGGPLSLIFRPNWGPKGRKNVFWRLPPPPLISGTPLPPYLKVWICDWLKTN